MHPIGYFYFAQVIDIISNPIEKDHELVWLDIKTCYDHMYLEHQGWAVYQAFMILNNELEISN